MAEPLRRSPVWVHHALMRERRVGALWALAWCGPVLLVLAMVLVASADFAVPGDPQLFENTYPNIVFGALVPLLGALVATRLPRHPLGWLFLGCGLASALTMAVFMYAETGLHHHLPGTVAAAWVSEWVWGLGLIPLVTIGVLLFPEGRVPGRRWRVLLVGDVIGVVLVFLSNAFHPGRLGNHPALENPLGVPLPRAVFGVLGTVGFGLFLVGLVGGAVGAFVRWRRADRRQRAQLGWFALSVAVLAVAVVAPLPKDVAAVVTVVAVPLLPVSVAVAILRDKLYGIEVVVRRSLVYGALSVALLVVYAAAVTLLGTLLRGPAPQVPALLGTALVAVAFAPVRQWLQHAVDRLLFGDRGDPYAVLSGLGRSLGAPVDSTDPLTEVASTLAASLRLPYVRVEVDDGSGLLVAEVGSRVPSLHEVPLAFRGQLVGRLLVAARTSRDTFRTAELRLLDDLGRQVGVVAHASRLARELQRSREGLVTTREEERRRIRRDLHDGLGPALAGVALGLDAVHRLAPQDAEAASRLAQDLKTEVQTSLADVRRLVEDLRPPALDHLGLVGAVRQHAVSLTERDPRLDVRVEGEPVCSLPAAVEVAAYRIATEALSNVSRHAAARRCRVLIALSDPTSGGGSLRVEVEDDGVGLPDVHRTGVGLAAMRERAVELGGTCETLRMPRGGTLVAARIPVVS
jgi:signal transduction histidine kinase